MNNNPNILLKMQTMEMLTKFICKHLVRESAAVFTRTNYFSILRHM